MIDNGFTIDLPQHGESRFYNAKVKTASCHVKNWDWVFELPTVPPTINIDINFNSGPFVEITGAGHAQHRVEFVDAKTGKLEFTTDIGMNCWARCNQRYYKEWLINVTELLSGEVTTHKFDLTGQNVLITLDSSALGDTLAWFPHIEEFRQKHNCIVWVSTFKNELYALNYPNLRFIAPGHRINNLYATYQLGWFYNENDVNAEMHPRDFRKLPMQATTTDILGLEYSALKPVLTIPNDPRPIEEPYVCIAMHSTAQAKYWNNPTGWQEVTDYWLAKGKKVVMLSLEENGYMQNFYPTGVTTITGNRTLENTMLYLKHCEMFIGVGSGLSWLSWSVGAPTVIISGFSKPITEPNDTHVIRVFKGGGCNGCFNRSRLDAGDWNWCPDQQGTHRQFECTRIITGTDVISAIEDYYEKGKAEKSVEIIVQESYELGMVQNHKEILGAAEFFKTLNVKNFMEIGTDQGGSFAIWSKLSEDGIRISVDLPHGQFGRADYDERLRDEYLRSLGSHVHMYWGDSHNPQMLKDVEEKLNGVLLDFMFIDGDHTYEGVKADYQMYKHLVKPGGWIAFHDIKDTQFHRNANCRVDQLWHELDGNKKEFIDWPSEYGGIGFVQV
jgi:autotransporter strand-loop-strand O-heptosyltransferase